MDRITLDYEGRFLRRRSLTTASGASLLVDLAETVSLNQGDAFLTTGGARIAIDAAADDGQRTKLFGDAQRILAEDAVNAFLFQLPKLGVWNRNLTGVWENSPVQANDVTGVAWK